MAAAAGCICLIMGVIFRVVVAVGSVSCCMFASQVSNATVNNKVSGGAFGRPLLLYYVQNQNHHRPPSGTRGPMTPSCRGFSGARSFSCCLDLEKPVSRYHINVAFGNFAIIKDRSQILNFIILVQVSAFATSTMLTMLSL
ncbi:hypothetical protein V6N12_060372 [Hibiscus sabdariffa]|uniref:Uncharacterized protein n=1 Tax=Hibiscus sabdariffa TaxID=183260 RepID=A0ABR2D4B0_9ROSI